MKKIESDVPGGSTPVMEDEVQYCTRKQFDELAVEIKKLKTWVELGIELGIFPQVITPP